MCLNGDASGERDKDGEKGQKRRWSSGKKNRKNERENGQHDFNENI